MLKRKKHIKNLTAILLSVKMSPVAKKADKLY